VARLLGELGACVFNADQVANELLRDGQVSGELTAAFGNEILSPSGEVDRARLAALVFGNKARLERLNAIIHPRVVRELETRLAEEARNERHRPVVLDVPLLLESALREVPQVLVFVEAPESTRRARLVEHRGWSGDELERRERHQLEVGEKRKRAHHVVRNSGTLQELEHEVQGLWRTLQKDQ
jgi:dephospho-CoA kinase